MTLFDQLQYSVDKADAPKVSVAVNALVTFGIGTPFINGGEEIMRTKIAAEDDLEATYYVAGDGTKISHNSYRSPDSVNSYKWDRKIEYLDYYEQYKSMIALRQEHSLFRINNASLIGRQYEGYPSKNMGFWDGDLAYSTIAAWYQNNLETLYVFANARESVQTGTVQSLISWGDSTDKVEVLFDSTGRYAVGSQLTASVMMDPYQVLLLKRI